MRQFTNEVVKGLFWEDYDDDVYTIIEEGDWSQDTKYQHCMIIFEFEGKNYRAVATRSGSPFTDWYYTWDDFDDDELVDCPEVEKKEIISHKWVKIKETK